MFRDPDMKPIPGEPEPKIGDAIGGLAAAVLTVIFLFCLVWGYQSCLGTTSPVLPDGGATTPARDIDPMAH